MKKIFSVAELEKTLTRRDERKLKWEKSKTKKLLEWIVHEREKRLQCKDDQRFMRILQVQAKLGKQEIKERDFEQNVIYQGKRSIYNPDFHFTYRYLVNNADKLKSENVIFLLIDSGSEDNIFLRIFYSSDSKQLKIKGNNYQKQYDSIKYRGQFEIYKNFGNEN